MLVHDLPIGIGVIASLFLKLKLAHCGTMACADDSSSKCVEYFDI